jgi:hypothetical protein
MRTKPLLLRDRDDTELARRVRSRSIPSGAAQRAPIILLACQGKSNSSIAELVGGVAADGNFLVRPLRRGRIGRPRRRCVFGPRSLDHREIAFATLMPPKKDYGCHTLEFMPAHNTLGDRYGTVARLWCEYGVQPWRSEAFKFSTDPELVAKVTDTVGLYLDPT